MGPIKQFSIKVSVFLALVVALFVLIAGVNAIYVSNTAFKLKEQQHVLVLGDSNTKCAFDESEYPSCANLSKAADSYFYSYLRLKKLVAENPGIDTLLLGFAPHNIFDNKRHRANEYLYSRVNKYYFLMNAEEVGFMWNQNPGGAAYGALAIVKQSLTNLAAVPKDGRALLDAYGAYGPLDRQILDEDVERLHRGEGLPFFNLPDTMAVSPTAMEYFDRIVSFCDERGIKLYLVNTPKRAELLAYPDYGVDVFNSYYDANYAHIDYLDFSDLPLAEEQYADLVHVHKSGAQYFSRMFEEQGLPALMQRYGRPTKP